MLQKAKDDNQFDIAEALKTRKPLRKTTKAKLMVDVGSESSGKDGSALLKKSPKINATSEGESKSYFLHETTHTGILAPRLALWVAKRIQICMFGRIRLLAFMFRMVLATRFVAASFFSSASTARQIPL